MKNLKDIKSVFFLGIGGIGMSALAKYFHQMGAKVSGYDKTKTPLTESLAAMGIAIFYDDVLANYPKDIDLVIYTPAIPATHLGLNFYKEKNYLLKKRAEVLGMISHDKTAICVAGSHGKTTVSSMIAHILTDSGFGCSAFLGGIAVNYNSNYIQHTNNYVVIEADEFDRSFHQLKPEMAVITAVDTDHLDIYGTKEKIEEAFIEFANKIDEEGFLAIKTNQPIQDRLPAIDNATYAFADESADVFCSKYWVVDGGYVFNLMYFGKEYKGFRLNIGGTHNIENAIAAITIAIELKIDIEKIKKAVASFSGIKRRFEFVVNTANRVYIDDYAHHPAEIDCFLQSVKELYPDKKIWAIFQPHLFSRTKDLATEFAAVLNQVDEVTVMDIYPARELPMPNVTSDLILDIITVKKNNLSPDEILKKAKATDAAVVVTIGAGDIDRLILPLKNIFNQ